LFSKFFELSGIALLAFGLAWYLGEGAGLLVSGAGLILVGITTNDEQIKSFFAYRWHMMRYHWHKQLAKESGEIIPSPHPPIKDDPVYRERSHIMARQRVARAKLHDRMPPDEELQP
jgi:hypothetical protein